jgi:hypothetical protein
MVTLIPMHDTFITHAKNHGIAADSAGNALGDTIKGRVQRAPRRKHAHFQWRAGLAGRIATDCDEFSAALDDIVEGHGPNLFPRQSSRKLQKTSGLI